MSSRSRAIARAAARARGAAMLAEHGLKEQAEAPTVRAATTADLLRLHVEGWSGGGALREDDQDRDGPRALRPLRIEQEPLPVSIVVGELGVATGSVARHFPDVGGRAAGPRRPSVG